MKLIRYLDLEAMLHVAEVIVWQAPSPGKKAAGPITGSTAAEDDEHWLRHTLTFIRPTAQGLNTKNVTITNYPPKERTY